MYATFGCRRWELETALNFLSQGYHEEIILAYLLLNIQLLVCFLMSVPSDSPQDQEASHPLSSLTVTHTFERLLWILDLILSPYKGQAGFCLLGCLVGWGLLTSAKLLR